MRLIGSDKCCRMQKLVSAVFTDQFKRPFFHVRSEDISFYLKLVVVLNEWNEMIIYSSKALFHKEKKKRSGSLCLVCPEMSSLHWLHFSVIERSRECCCGFEAVLVTWIFFVQFCFVLFFIFFMLIVLQQSMQKPLCNCHICFIFIFTFACLLHLCSSVTPS